MDVGDLAILAAGLAPCVVALCQVAHNLARSAALADEDADLMIRYQRALILEVVIIACMTALFGLIASVRERQDTVYAIMTILTVATFGTELLLLGTDKRNISEFRASFCDRCMRWLLGESPGGEE